MDHDDDLEPAGIEAELVELTPVTGELTVTTRAVPGALPSLRTAAVAASGFIAGAATVALLRRVGAGRRAVELAERDARARVHPVPGFGPVPAGSSRTYLVTVRAISRP